MHNIQEVKEYCDNVLKLACNTILTRNHFEYSCPGVICNESLNSPEVIDSNAIRFKYGSAVYQYDINGLVELQKDKYTLNEFPFDKDSEIRRLKQLEINHQFLLNAIMEIHSNLCPEKFGTWQMKVEQAVKASRELIDDDAHS